MNETTLKLTGIQTYFMFHPFLKKQNPRHIKTNNAVVFVKRFVIT